MAKPGRLLWLSPVVYYGQARSSIVTNSTFASMFGGSFNPIHTGHIALAKSLCQQAGLDEVWLMVSPMNPFKKEATDLLTDKLRL